MKKKLIVSSLLSIVLCFVLICGATFALFTSESKVNLVISSGKVNVTASVGEIETYSLTDPEKNLNGAFELGGSASYVDGAITLDKMAPGDKAVFNISITNNSNVSVLYRTRIDATNDDGLFSGLNVTIARADSEAELESASAEKLSSKRKIGAWTMLDASTENTVVQVLRVTVELPNTANNEYDNQFQNKKCDFIFLVEAIQGNAYSFVDVTIENIDNTDFGEENQIFRLSGEFSNGIDLSDEVIGEGSEFTFDNVKAPFVNLPDGAVITGDSVIDFSGETATFAATETKKAINANGSITLSEGTLTVTNSDYLIYSNSEKASITIEDMTITADNVAKNGIEITNSSTTVRDENGACITGENSSTLIIKNSNLSLGAGKLISVTASNGSATLEIENSRIDKCGNIFVGGHSNNAPATVATFNVKDSYLSCEENGLSSTIAIWGQNGIESTIVDSEIHTYSRGWHQSEDANDNSITFQSGTTQTIKFERSNFHLYGGRSIINARNYGSSNYTCNFAIDECLIWVVTKSNHGELTIPVWGIAEDGKELTYDDDGALINGINNSMLLFTKNVHQSTPAIFTSFIYGNPVIHGTYSIITQANWDVDFNVVDQTVTFKKDMQMSIYEGANEHNFVLGENGKVVIESGAKVENVGIKAAEGYTLVTNMENGNTIYSTVKNA